MIPILLIQRDGFAEYRKSEYRGGWNIVIPAGWGMDFWKGFIFAGAWVGGKYIYLFTMLIAIITNYQLLSLLIDYHRFTRKAYQSF